MIVLGRFSRFLPETHNRRRLASTAIVRFGGGIVVFREAFNLSVFAQNGCFVAKHSVGGCACNAQIFVFIVGSQKKMVFYRKLPKTSFPLSDAWC
ncbi:MAG: hypothetical protein MUD08_15320 [Cytophagales bacterium]|nr:hypothetical protein [Cytophagales bacterium]